MREIIVGGLLLPLRLYFQPTTFRQQVAALAPDLPDTYSLWKARRRLREPAFRQGLALIGAQVLVAMSWAVWAALACAVFDLTVNWSLVALVVAVGVVYGVVLGGAWRLAGALAGSVGIGVALGVAIGVVEVVTSGVAGAVASVVASGEALGVALGVALGMVLGMAFGVVLAMIQTVTMGVPQGVVSSAMMGIMAALMVGVTGMMTGLPFDNALGAVLLLALFVATIVASTLAATHAVVWPLQAGLSLINWVALGAGAPPAALWRVAPVRWDEVILLPLPGLRSLLVQLHRSNPAQGRAALTVVAAHRYQAAVAAAAWAELAQDAAAAVGSLPALAAFQRELSWLNQDTRLAGSVKQPLLRMGDLSREVAGALASDSAANRVRRLRAAQDLLATLRQQPGPFGAALVRWEPLLDQGLAAAERQQAIEEPIPQVYAYDGRPIHPANRPDSALPFKGRRTLFRQLEAALGGGAGERATLLLHGQQRTGKTSALLQLPRRLGSQVVPAFLDLHDSRLGSAGDAASFLHGLASIIVDEARRHRQLSLPEIAGADLARDPYPAFGRWLDRVEASLGPRALLLCLDEFETLEQAIAAGRLDTRVLATLRNLIQHHPQVAVLLAGSHHIDELPPHWAAALVSTATLPISFLDAADARELVEQPVADFPRIYTPEAVDRILWLTHCQPYLVQLMCGLLVQRMNAARRLPPTALVTPADVDAVVPTALQTSSYFSGIVRTQAAIAESRQVLSALAAAPDGRLDRPTLARLVGGQRLLAPALAQLTRRELITPFDDTYQLTLPLLGAYLQDSP